jgi:hypothetical protein
MTAQSRTCKHMGKHKRRTAWLQLRVMATSRRDKEGLPVDPANIYYSYYGRCGPIARRPRLGALRGRCTCIRTCKPLLRMIFEGMRDANRQLELRAGHPSASCPCFSSSSATELCLTLTEQPFWMSCWPESPIQARMLSPSGMMYVFAVGCPPPCPSRRSLVPFVLFCRCTMR